MAPSLPFVLAAILAFVGGTAAVVQKRRSLASWCFCGGMVILAGEILLAGIAAKAVDPEERGSWRSLELAVGSLFPGFWLCFSLVYSRGDARESLRRFGWILLLAVIVPVGLGLGFRSELVRVVRFGEGGGEWAILWNPPARVLMVLLLLASVGILINLERTFRAAVGTARWRIKYVFLGVGLIFGVKIYVLSQGLLFSRINPDMAMIQSVALVLGTCLFGVAHLRKGFSDLDIYPSRVVLRNSLTVILVGAYLVVVGVLAQVVAFLGGIKGFPAQAFLILVGIVGLAVLLLSDRLRSKLGQFVTRHFKRPEHDYRSVWTRATESFSSKLDRSEMCEAAARLIAETYHALSVTVFLVDEHAQCLAPEATTSPERDEGRRETKVERIGDSEVLEGLLEAGEPFDLENLELDWVNSLREYIESQFERGGNRMVVPLTAGERLIGMVSLADRVNGVPYTAEELELLACLANHIAASLLNLQLNEELVRGKELEAFQTVSTFFVHDMKNAANSLNLTLQNLPVHFDDPEFREDALRGIGKTVGRINQLTERLSSLRKRLELQIEEADLNKLIEETLDELPIREDVEIVKDLKPLPTIRFDREQIRTVLTNLVLNAEGAIGDEGRIVIETAPRNGSVVLSVEDNGCGMSSEFIRMDLFRPFRSTKSKGLGIGLFQSRTIVEAHRGTIQVESTLEEGTTFRVSLPLE